MKKIITEKIEESFIDTFELVKDAVRKNEGRSRAGLMLGLQELGASQNGFIGAYYQVASNIIILNTTPIRRIIETKPKLLEPYGFHVLLHEYIHSLGFLDEETTEKKTYEITKKYFGKNHIATALSEDINKFLPNLIYPIQGWEPTQGLPEIKLVKGFDRSCIENYIT
jgi:hypothetical protein